MYTLRSGEQKIAIFYHGDFLACIIKNEFETNLNGWSSDQIIEALIDEGLLDKNIKYAQKAYANLYWACHAAESAAKDKHRVLDAHNRALDAIVSGDEVGNPLYVAERQDRKNFSSNPFGNDEDFGGDRWKSKGINMLSHKEHVENARARFRVSGTDLPPGIIFRDVAVIIAGETFPIYRESCLDVQTICRYWDRQSDFFTH